MLTLRRKPGQAVVIGECIRVVTLPGRKLGIDAPSDISIRREELTAFPPKSTLMLRLKNAAAAGDLATILTLIEDA